jgi:hypothetical protein
MMEQYGRIRSFLPRLLNDIVFKAAPAGKITLDAFHYLASLGSARQQILENPPLGIITSPVKRFVFDKEGRVSKRGYTLCFFDNEQMYTP